MDFNSLAREYRTIKNQADKYKKEAERLNKLLKERMVDTPKVESEGYVFERKVTTREKLDTESLIQWLEDNGYTNALTTTVTLNEEILAEMVEEGEVSIDDLEPFIERREVVTLYCKKARKEEEELAYVGE